MATADQMHAYYIWLRDRGLTHPIPLRETLEAIEKPAELEKCSFDFSGENAKVGIFIETDASSLKELPQEEKALLAKMLKAIDLNFSETYIQIINSNLESVGPHLSLLEETHIKSALVFGSHSSIAVEVKGSFECPHNLINLQLGSTFSLQEIENTPSLKGEVWKHLQSFKSITNQ